jgi:hypothetical protein
MFEARHQSFGHVMAAHTLLHRADVVGHAAVFPDVVGDIQHGIGRLRVLVAGLADAAGVDDLAMAVQPPFFPIGRKDRARIAVFVDLFIDYGLVGVTHQAVRGFKVMKVQGGDQGFQDVFPHRFARAAMRQRVIANDEGRRQIFQVLGIVGGQRLACPVDCFAGIRVKRANIQAAQRRPVMITGQAQVGHGPQQFYALIRVRSIAHHITQAPDVIPLATRIFQNGLKSRKISVDIGDDEYAHGVLLVNMHLKVRSKGILPCFEFRSELFYPERCEFCVKVLLLLVVLSLSACFVESEPLAAPLTTPQPTVATLLAHAAGDVMRGICFEAAADAAGQVFVLRSTEDLIRFYDLADNSQLCRRPVERVSFDFGDGQVLAGVWSRGTGCTAAHEVVSMTRDRARQQITIDLRFVTEGTCPYDLVQPYWVALDDAADYVVTITVATDPR